MGGLSKLDFGFCSAAKPIGIRQLQHGFAIHYASARVNGSDVQVYIHLHGAIFPRHRKAPTMTRLNERMVKINKKAFLAGFFDGLTGGPLWRFIRKLWDTKGKHQ
jgi:hypothetical protein